CRVSVLRLTLGFGDVDDHQAAGVPAAGAGFAYAVAVPVDVELVAAFAERQAEGAVGGEAIFVAVEVGVEGNDLGLAGLGVELHHRGTLIGDLAMGAGDVVEVPSV